MMFDTAAHGNLAGALEALLFVSDEPVNAITLADMLGVEPPVAQSELEALRDRLASSTPILRTMI